SDHLTETLAISSPTGPTTRIGFLTPTLTGRIRRVPPNSGGVPILLARKMTAAHKIVPSGSARRRSWNDKRYDPIGSAPAHEPRAGRKDSGGALSIGGVCTQDGLRSGVQSYTDGRR